MGFKTDSECARRVNLFSTTVFETRQLWGRHIKVLKLSMMIFPLICILLGFVLYQKKFKIDEEFYAKIVSDLEERNGKKEEK